MMLSNMATLVSLMSSPAVLPQASLQLTQLNTQVLQEDKPKEPEDMRPLSEECEEGA